jgi:hypothetical protein
VILNKRIVLKITAICLGIFIVISSLAAYYLFHNYQFDTERKYSVLIASTDINPGDVINDSMVISKTIKESCLNSYMITDKNNCISKKAISKINAGDYIVDYNLLSKESWYKDEDKIIVLPMDVEGRLANLIKKGSLIDIKVIFDKTAAIPQTVLSKVKVEDILDENGISLGDSIGSKKAYAKVILNNQQRNKIYVATQFGKLIFELYCDSIQKPAVEEFQIPSEYLSKTPSNPITQLSENSGSLPTMSKGGVH